MNKKLKTVLPAQPLKNFDGLFRFSDEQTLRYLQERLMQLESRLIKLEQRLQELEELLLA